MSENDNAYKNATLNLLRNAEKLAEYGAEGSLERIIYWAQRDGFQIPVTDEELQRTIQRRIDTPDEELPRFRLAAIACQIAGEEPPPSP
jgi:hypothetical protein